MSIIDEGHKWLCKLKSHRNFPEHVTCVEPLRTDMPGFNLVTDMLDYIYKQSDELTTLRESVAEISTDWIVTQEKLRLSEQRVKELEECNYRQKETIELWIKTAGENQRDRNLICDQIEDLEAKAKQLAEAVVKWTAHDFNCNGYNAGQACTCRAAEATKTAKEILG